MARYKIVDRSPRFLPVVLDAQLMSGSFEYALDYLIDHQLDLGTLDRRYRNDDTGSTAYDPRVLLKSDGVTKVMGSGLAFCLPRPSTKVMGSGLAFCLPRPSNDSAYPRIV